jgi:hypothetical protein
MFHKISRIGDNDFPGALSNIRAVGERITNSP